MARKTRDKDKGMKKILREMNSLENASIDAGYFRGVQSDDPTITLAEVATFNEFRLRDGVTPTWPFMRPAFDKNIAKYKRVSKELMLQLVGQRLGSLKVLRAIGALMVSDIKQEITNVRAPPNAPATKDAKGFDNPLIETGTMKNRADFRVRLK